MEKRGKSQPDFSTRFWVGSGWEAHFSQPRRGQHRAAESSGLAKREAVWRESNGQAIKLRSGGVVGKASPLPSVVSVPDPSSAHYKALELAEMSSAP